MNKIIIIILSSFPSYHLQDTCFDVFENTTGDAGEKMKKLLQTGREITINGLDIISELEHLLSLLMIKGTGRKLLSDESRNVPVTGGFPSWVNEGRRSLLSSGDVKADVVVAQDGSGKYKTINEALKDIPQQNIGPFVIHIKAGIYNEQVKITKQMNHVVLVGDGPTRTKITGDKNEIAGQNIFENPTVGKSRTPFLVD